MSYTWVVVEKKRNRFPAGYTAMVVAHIVAMRFGGEAERRK